MNDVKHTLGYILVVLSYIIVFFTSIIWISFLPNIIHGFVDLKAEVVIGGIFWLAWICSHAFLLLANSVIWLLWCRSPWLVGFMMLQILLLFAFSYVWN